MNKVTLQFWEESERGHGIIPNGCSLHLDIESRNNYVTSIYNQRSKEFIPNEYDRITGDPLYAFVSDTLYSDVVSNNSSRLTEIELNNLISLQEIIIGNGQ